MLVGVRPAPNIAVSVSQYAWPGAEQLCARGGVETGFTEWLRGIFPGLSVADNLRVPVVALGRPGRPVGAGDFDPLTAFPVLAERRSQSAGSLSGGEQQMLAVGRALTCNPALLLVDEFSEGVQPNVVEAIGEQIQATNRRGTAVVLVEQNARLALRISRRAYVLEKGRVVVSGPSRDLAGDETLLRKYLVV